MFASSNHLNGPAMLRLLFSAAFSVAFCIGGFGCGKSGQGTGDRESFEAVPPSAEAAATLKPTPLRTADQLRAELGADESARFEKAGRKFVMALLTNSGARTLEPLRGEPLKALDISQTPITDLSPVAGMPLENIGLAETQVSDLSPLKGIPLRHLDATRSPIEDISALAGMTQLTHLYLEGARVRDLSPLQDARLRVVWLNGCPVDDLSPLAGKQLDELNLCDTPLQDLNTVQTMQIGTLWMRNTQVSSLAPLAEHQLVSLDVQGSPIVDLVPLAQMSSLKRLNIAETAVTDLAPLAGLRLERLIFSPASITAGIEVVRNMPSLQAIDTSFDGDNPQPLPPDEFWRRYEAGDFSPPQPADAPN